MERLKSKLNKILLTIDFIAEEKISIQENLNHIIDQVLTKANYLKTNNEYIQHRNISSIQKYILNVYQRFCEINSTLDILIEENNEPVDILPRNDDHDCSIKQFRKNSVIIQSPQVQHISELPGTTGTESEDGDNNIQNLKKSLSEFSEKLGLNKQNVSVIKDYYDNSNISFQTNTSTAENIVMPSSYVEIPEKDINTEPKQIRELDNSNISGLSEQIIKRENLDNQSFLISDKYTQTDQQSQNTKTHNYIGLSNSLEDRESVISSPEIKSSKTVVHNFAQKIQDQTKKDDTNQNNFYEIKLKETPKVDEEFLISHIESPDEFYIHVVDNVTTSIDKLSAEINNYCRHLELVNYGSREEALAKMGKFCLAFIEEYESWYRVEILNVKDIENVVVRLVDYGYRESVSYKYLLNLTEELSRIPMLAIKCHFPLLYPPESTPFHKLTSWPKSTTEAISSLCNPTQHFKIVYASRERNQSVAIDFICKDISDDTIGQLLIDGGFAVQILDDYDENNIELSNFLIDMDTAEIDNVNEAVLGYDPKDEARICRFTKSDGTCYKGQHCKLEHGFLAKDGFTTDKESVFTEAMYPLILPPINSIVMILITGYIDICRFYGQIIQKPHHQGKYTIDHDLNLLLKEMNSTKVVNSYKSYKISPALGEVVIVKHYKNWLRAIVRDIKTNETGNLQEVKLFLLDAGENITSSIEKIRKITPHFLKLPFQAVEFYISNFQMRKDCSAENAKQFFMKNLYFRNFLATTKSLHSPLKVELKSLDGCILVGQTLEQNGYAERRTRDINISEMCNLDV